MPDKTTRTKFTEVAEGKCLLSVNGGIPVELALSNAEHLLDAIVSELAGACMGEPLSDERAYLMFVAAEQARALVASCAEGMAE
ncbi:MAG: hypothetical protein FHK79_21960 [Pseudomonas sp.]|nr:MAG: hypothetical protein FHK79_21960 [Pseudomonas sp.]